MKKKICSICKKKLSINKFYPDTKGRHKFGVSGRCKKCEIKYQREYRRNNPIKAWCSRTIRDHKRYCKILFTAVKSLYPIAKDTKYCPIYNIKLDWEFGKGKAQSNSPTLDRKDNKKILTLDNIWIICRRCNTTKQDRSMEELYKWCKNFMNKFNKFKI